MRFEAAIPVALAMLAASPTVALADCQCLANGREYHLGEIACLSLHSGSQLARCEMVLNNSSWKKIRDGCPEADAAPLSGAGAAAKTGNRHPTWPMPLRSGGGAG